MTLLFLGLGHGASIIISQLYGSGERERVKSAVDTCVVLLVVCGLLCTALGILLAAPVLRLIATPESLMEQSTFYLRIIFAGSVPSLGYTIIAALLNAVGNSRTPLALLGAAAVLNVALDLLFVPVLGMGVGGLALATVIAQAVSLAGCLVYLGRADSLIALRLRGFRFSWKMLALIVKLGVPTGLQNALMMVSMMVLQKATNEFGVAVIAGRAIESRIEGIMLIPLAGISTAVMTFVGQNTGAGKEERVKQGLKNGFVMGAAVSFAFWLALLLFSNPILAVFSSDAAALFEAKRCTDIIAPAFVFYSPRHGLAGLFPRRGRHCFSTRRLHHNAVRLPYSRHRPVSGSMAHALGHLVPLRLKLVPDVRARLGVSQDWILEKNTQKR